jgi:hypothetical protein
VQNNQTRSFEFVLCSREIGRLQAAPKTTLFKQRGVEPGAGRDPSRIIEHARTDPSRVGNAAYTYPRSPRPTITPLNTPICSSFER